MIHEIVDSNWKSQVHALREKLQHITFLTAITGAGISAASGLPLEDEKVYGLPLKRFFDKEFWLSSPEAFFELYRKICRHWRGAMPNQAHITLARIGARVVTQNIDGLHRDAGTEHLLEVHGNLRELRCENCHSIFSSDLANEIPIPACTYCGTILRPGITFEGEEIRHASLAFDWIGRSDILLIVGTMLHMSPLNIANRIASEKGSTVVWINTAADIILPEIFA